MISNGVSFSGAIFAIRRPNQQEAGKWLNVENALKLNTTRSRMSRVREYFSKRKRTVKSVLWRNKSPECIPKSRLKIPKGLVASARNTFRNPSVLNPTSLASGYRSRKKPPSVYDRFKTGFPFKSFHKAKVGWKTLQLVERPRGSMQRVASMNHLQPPFKKCPYSKADSPSATWTNICHRMQSVVYWFGEAGELGFVCSLWSTKYIFFVTENVLSQWMWGMTRRLRQQIEFPFIMHFSIDVR